MKVQKTRKYYRKENHNKKLFQERKETFLNVCKSLTKKIEHISQPTQTNNSTRISEILPTIITPNVNNIGAVVNHVDSQMIDMLKDPQKLKEFKEFQEFLKLKETGKIINTAQTTEQLPPIHEEKDSYNETTNNYDIDEEIEEVLEDEDY